jgi:hypothetical protein
MVVKTPVEKFITSIAPRNEKPFTVADGTAAYPTGRAVGKTMLEVGPGRRTLPILASVVVFTAKTLFVTASNAARTLRFGFRTIRLGEVPALRGEIRARVSFDPSMYTSLPVRRLEVTS